MNQIAYQNNEIIFHKNYAFFLACNFKMPPSIEITINLKAFKMNTKDTIITTWNNSIYSANSRNTFLTLTEHNN